MPSACRSISIMCVAGRSASSAPARSAPQSTGVVLLASGDFLGQARNGDEPAVGVGRVTACSKAPWRSEARSCASSRASTEPSSPAGRTSSRRSGTTSSRCWHAPPAGRAAGVTLLLENHSDFTAAEYRSIVDEVGAARIGVFLDLINPIAALDDPVPVVEALARSHGPAT